MESYTLIVVGDERAPMRRFQLPRTRVRRAIWTAVAFVAALLMVTAPAYSGIAVQIFHCQEDENATEEKLEAAAAKWLKAARSMKGGEEIQVALRFPVAVDMDEDDFDVIVTAPTFAKWGEFWDNYKSSPAEVADTEFAGLADCPDSGLWELVIIK